MSDPADAVLAGIEARHEIAQPLPYLFRLDRRDGQDEPTS